MVPEVWISFPENGVYSSVGEGGFTQSGKGDKGAKWIFAEAKMGGLRGNSN